jgi:hypothetical protein
LILETVRGGLGGRDWLTDIWYFCSFWMVEIAVVGQWITADTILVRKPNSFGTSSTVVGISELGYICPGSGLKRLCTSRLDIELGLKEDIMRASSGCEHSSLRNYFNYSLQKNKQLVAISFPIGCFPPYIDRYMCRMATWILRSWPVACPPRVVDQILRDRNVSVISRFEPGGSRSKPPLLSVSEILPALEAKPTFFPVSYYHICSFFLQFFMVFPMFWNFHF